MSFMPEHAVVWTEIPVSDLEAAMVFYNAVLETEMVRDDTGPNPVSFFQKAGGPMSPGIAGHLYPGKPGAGVGATVHLAIDGTAEAARDRAVAAGGSVEGPIVEMPFGRWAYVRDPDGNSLGLFQAAV